MDDIDEVIEAIDRLSDTVYKLSKSVKVIETDIRDMKKIMCLAIRPDDASIERYATLAKAYREYEFVKRMVLGNDGDK